MTPERWQEVKQIFHAALEREPPARREFLDQACGGNKMLLGEVESLLASYELSGEFIDAPAFELATNLLNNPESTPEQIGSYRVLSKLGRGGMGEVYLAEDARLGRKVALKVLPQTHVNDPDRMRRFEQEARAASGLNQPNILTIHEIGEFNGHRYIVTEYIEGQTLRDAMQIQPLTVGESLSVAEQVASALAAAHAAGIIHRDIKPENIMLRQDGIVKVLDFGLAKLNPSIERGSDDPTQPYVNTGSGLVMGTVAYMSPEQARGIKIDARTDIWSLGVVLYEMISGERPFTGSTSSDVLVSVLEREPPPLDIAALGIPETLEFIIAKALTKDCEGRYQSAREFLTDIRRLKQRLNFADELERRGAREILSSSGAQKTKGTGAGATQIQSIAELQSEQLSGALIRERRMKRGLAVAVPLLIISAIAVVYMLSVIRKRGETVTNSPEVLRTTQIATKTGLEILALSPDGNSVAYASRPASGPPEIFVKPLTEGAREIQITSDGGGNVQPAWSRDGKWIAYRSGTNGGIWIIPSTGGTAKQLTSFGALPSWSADGSSIAFQSDNTMMPPTTIWTVSSQGGEPVQLTKPGVPLGGHSVPVWSPDGRRVTFIAYCGFLPGQMWTVTPTGDDLKQVVKDKSLWFKGGTYSPDGRFLYSGAVTENNSFVFYKIPVSPTGEGGDPILMKDLGLSYIDRNPTMSADGKKLVYSSQTPTGELVSVPISVRTGEAIGPPKALTQSSGFRKSLAAFSRDGETIAYLQWSAGQGQKLWLMDTNGGNARQLTSGADVHWSNSWLPDNDTIVFLSHHQANQSLKSISVRSGREKLLANLNQPTGWARVSPDGQQIAFNCPLGGAMNTWMMSINGDHVRQLTFDREGTGWPSWSPDGKLLAVEIKRATSSYLAVMPSGGGEVTQVTFDEGQVHPHSWSPDGDKIVFAGQRKGVWNLYWYSLSTKQQKQLTFYDGSDHYVRYPAWSPKGDQVIFEYASATGVTWLMELK